MRPVFTPFLVVYVFYSIRVVITQYKTHEYLLLCLNFKPTTRIFSSSVINVQNFLLMT